MDEVLHAVRLRGIATPQAVVDMTGLELADIESRLSELVASDLVLERPSKKRPGFVLTESGRDHHAAMLADAHTPDQIAVLQEHYDGFLAVNGDIKGLSARWQSAGDDERFDLIDKLEDLHEKARPVFTSAGGAVARFGRYGERLGVALEKLDDDPRYFVSPQVDSYHTVWFECHEDFLLTLGRTRRGEGSE
jgi:hypothetical protein